MKGEVRLRVRGLMPEKLLERALEQGIHFTTVKTGDDHTMVVEASERDARRLLKLCRRFSIPAEVMARRGGSAFRRWLRRRWTLGVGLLTGAVFCGLFLSRIWFIDISFAGDAAQRGDPALIEALLYEKGIFPGVSRSIDTVQLSDALLSEAGDYSYIGIRTQGICLRVEAVPELEAPEVYDVDTPRNLYASLDGIVVSINAEAGEPCVKPGDAVRRGQMLIRGAERASGDENRAIAALGEVVVRAWFAGSAEGRLRQAQVRYTGRQSVSTALVTPWFQIPIVEGTRFDHQSTRTEVQPVGGLYLPVSVRRVVARETKYVMETGDRELLSSRLVALAMADARVGLTRRGPSPFKIARSWVRYTQPEQDLLRANAVCEIYTNTAVPWEALRQGG